MIHGLHLYHGMALLIGSHYLYFILDLNLFLKTTKDRRQISLLFIFGTIPLLISGILQYFFKIYGPFETLNGLIIWFSRSLGPDEGLTGLFNNSNYAGAWLSLVFLFSLALCQEKRSQTTKIISYLYLHHYSFCFNLHIFKEVAYLILD